MNFTSPAALESTVWEMRLADFTRASNRDLINNLFDGGPPYTPEEERQNSNIKTNYNDLSATKIAHDARRQYYNGLIAPDPLFRVSVDYGEPWKRQGYSMTITQRLNRIIGHSAAFREIRRNVFASAVLHGIGPSSWDDQYSWRGKTLGIEDVLIPSGTLLTFDNVELVAIFRQYTGAQLWRLTHGPRVDPAWNMPLVESALKWVDQEAQKLMGSTWPEVWAPEKMGQRIKEDGGLYTSDQLPTIDCWDCYFWNDEGKKSGWNKRVILDAWGHPGVGGVSVPESKDSIPDKTYLGTRGAWLYGPEPGRKYAPSLDQIIHFQFADCSSVAPFRYHTIRSLGFLLYAVCHLQNRFNSKLTDAGFEAMMQFFRVANQNEGDRMQVVNLIDKGFLPRDVDMVKAADRWQYNTQLAELILGRNRQTMADNSASFTQDFDFATEDRKTQETATRTMAKVNASAAMVAAMLNQAYDYEYARYKEICRRFCIKNSRDKDVREFRVGCLRDGVPPEAIDSSRWEIEMARVVGGGNKMMQVAIADKLMAIRQFLDPDGQKEVDRIYIAAHSDDYDLATRLVPQQKQVSDSVHDAERAAAGLLAGLPQTLKQGVNHQEYAQTLIWQMSAEASKLMRAGAMPTPEQVAWLFNIAGMGPNGQRIPPPSNGIQAHIDILAQDKTAKALVKELGDDLGKLLNEAKGLAQRLAEQHRAKGNGQGGLDPKDLAKIQGMQLQAQTKAQLAAKSHAERTAQKQISFEQGLRQDAMRHDADLAMANIKANNEIRQNRLRSLDEPAEEK